MYLGDVTIRKTALRVVPEKTPGCVVCGSFGITKPLSSRLDWRFFRFNRATFLIVNTPESFPKCVIINFCVYLGQDYKTIAKVYLAVSR